MDIAALNIVKGLVPHDPYAQGFLASVGSAESDFGRGWDAQGAGSNNWGAITGTGPAGYFIHADSYADPQGVIHHYETKFRKYPTRESGAADLQRRLSLPIYQTAYMTGSLLICVAAHYQTGFFTSTSSTGIGALKAYHKFLSGKAQKVKNAGVLTMPFPDLGIPPTDEACLQAWRWLIGDPNTSVPTPIHRMQKLVIPAADFATRERLIPRPPPPWYGVKSGVPGASPQAAPAPGQQPAQASPPSIAPQEDMREYDLIEVTPDNAGLVAAAQTAAGGHMLLISYTPGAGRSAWSEWRRP